MSRLSDFRYRDFYLASLIFVLFGLSLDSFTNIYQGIINILTSPSVLVSDYMEIGGMGAAFVNAGLMLVFSAFVADKSGARLTGALISGLFTVLGFSFFGKNILNTIPLMLGVYLYCKYKNLEVSNYMHVMCFVTGISPVVSLFYFGLNFNIITGIILGTIVGILVGFIIIPISANMIGFHDGYSLYNVGFSLGIIGIIIAGNLRMFDRLIPEVNIIYTGSDLYPLVFLLIICTIFACYGLVKNKGLKGYGKLLKQSGRLVSDFTILFNKYLVIFNVGITGIIAILYVKICGGVINGPILGGILTVMGFSVFGKHPKNILPIMLGVLIASIFNKYDPSGTPAILTALFSTTIAPIAGEFGILAGLFAGFSHKAVATNVGFIHGGINLYNNGLAGGFVAAVLVPLFRNLIERYKDE
ncbi:DUF1576 domain-containing protein [Anaerococcus urinomassiliensis]|uniref:DUF1576 domain-containing protein n=1 Tax=Anaerococcus urinomassiliensis TaxID=1745712 RepID=UPI00093A6B19|nr:DUF1576 domain-containing protein [Anaerococcus urinomassiliensis]